LLLNLAIAIISSTFNSLEAKKISLFYKEILEVMPFYKFDKYYGSMISSFPPFNVLFLPFIIILSFIKEKKTLIKLNNYWAFFTFSPVYLISMIVFTIANFLFIPFTYFTVNLFVIKNLFSRVSRVRMSSIKNLPLTLLLLPFKLFISLVFDLIFFAKF